MTLKAFDQAELDAAVESATVKALTGDPATDMYAPDRLVGFAKLRDVPDWQTRTSVPPAQG